MDLSERILYLIDKKGVTVYEISLSTGISQSVISRITNKETNKLQFKNLKLLANYFNVSPDWLRTGEGEMLLNNNISASNVKDDINYLNKTIMDLNEKIKLMEENKALSEELISVQRKHIAFLESAMNIAEAKKKESNVG